MTKAEQIIHIEALVLTMMHERKKYLVNTEGLATHQACHIRHQRLLLENRMAALCGMMKFKLVWGEACPDRAAVKSLDDTIQFGNIREPMARFLGYQDFDSVVE